MVSVVVFLCALALSPSECSRATAVDVIALPAAPDEQACLRDGAVDPRRAGHPRRRRASLGHQVRPRQPGHGPGRLTAARPRSRALTARQERLFLALAFAAGLLLQLALL